MKKKISVLCIILISLLTFKVLTISNNRPVLKGTYQSEIINDNYTIQFSIVPETETYIEYINQREVDSGTYIKINSNVYRLTSELQSLEITLNKDNYFEIQVSKLSGSAQIKITNTNSIPVFYSTIFNDENLYKELINN